MANLLQSNDLEINASEHARDYSTGFHADLAETIGFEKLDEVLTAWDDRNNFLTKYKAIFSPSRPMKSRAEIEESIATFNKLINECQLSDDDKRILMDSVKTLAKLFDNYGLSYSLNFVHRNIEDAADKELERMKEKEAIFSMI